MNDEHEATPGAVRRRVAQWHGTLEQVVADLEAGGQPVDLPLWRDRLDDIGRRSHERPRVAVALIGGTGAGKSTLLNALLGARIVPVSSMRACTAAITEVAYGEGPAYRATVEFVSRVSWEEERAQLTEDLRDYVVAARETDGQVPAEIRTAAADKLRAVHGTDAANRFLDSLDPADLVESPEITRALDSGETEIRSVDLDEFRRLVRQFLDSGSSYWPIVQRVRITGPFVALAGGAELIDLPGLNDPNKAREAVTRDYLKHAKFVWLVFSMKRALTQDVYKVLSEGDLFRQLFMDGRTDALTFVGTGSDDINPDEDREQFGLDEDDDDLTIVRHRNRAVAEHVREQLGQLAAELAQAAGEGATHRQTLTDQLNACPLFTVSARDSLHVAGVSRNRYALFDSPEGTEIPGLRAHLDHVCANFGVAAAVRDLHRELDSLGYELDRAIRARRSQLELAAQMKEMQLGEVRAAVEQTATFLGQRCTQARKQVATDLQAAERLLDERLNAAATRAAIDSERLRQRWLGLHWATIRATARRGGRHVSANGPVDLARDIAKPLLDAIAFAWVDFFGRELTDVLQRGERELVDAGNRYLVDLSRELGGAESLTPVLKSDGEAMREATVRLLDEKRTHARRAINERIETDRRDLQDMLIEQIDTHMTEAYERAAADRGKGTKQRMVEIMYTEAVAVNEGLFGDVRLRLSELVDELTRWMAEQFDDMALSLEQEAARLTSYLDGASQQPTAEVGIQLDCLATAEARLSALSAPAA
jgi:dephospho-CoA kinase